MEFLEFLGVVMVIWTVACLFNWFLFSSAMELIGLKSDKQDTFKAVFIMAGPLTTLPLVAIVIGFAIGKGLVG